MIHIVIPVFNRKAFTKACLQSLQKQTYQDFKVIVTDDGSTDGTEEMLKTEFPEVSIIKGDGNLWWTAATNLGIRQAMEEGTDYVLTLNNDTLATEDYLEKLVYWAKQKPKALLGSFALDSESKKPVYGGLIHNWASNKTRDLIHILKPEEQEGIHKVSFFPGRGLLIPVEVFEQVGLFDEKVFPHYYADYDFTLQAIKGGYEVYVNFDAKLYIYPEASGDRQNRHKKSLKKYYDHLFGIRGGGNLANYTRYVVRHCPPIYLPYVLVNGYARRIFGYLVK